MAKKAKLDLIETGDGAGEVALRPAEVEKEAVPDAPAGRKKAFLSGRMRIIVIAAVCVLVLSGAAGALKFYLAGKTKAPDVTESRQTEQAAAELKKILEFDQFVVDVKDNKGEMRIVFYDIGIELDKPHPAAAAHERIDIRNAVYGILKNRQAFDGLTPEGRNGIKDEIKKELNRLLGSDSVKNVYIASMKVI